MQLPLPQLRGNRPVMAVLSLVVVAVAGTYAASSLRGQATPLAAMPLAGQMGYCCNVDARSCDGPFLAANPAMCNIPGYSGLLFSYGQGNDAQREEAFSACQVACGIPTDGDAECPMVECAMPMLEPGCHLVESVDEAGCAQCPQVVCDGKEGGGGDGEFCTVNFRCPVPMLDPGCRLAETTDESGCAQCPQVVCDGDGGDGPVCQPPPCAVPLVPDGCRLEGNTDELGCPLCPSVVCDGPDIGVGGGEGGGEDCRPPEVCPVPELAFGCRMEERYDERGCAECPGVVCEDVIGGGDGGPICQMPPCAVPFVPPGCRLQSQTDDVGCPVCPTLACDGDGEGGGSETGPSLDAPQVIGGGCGDVFPQLQFVSRSGRFIGFTANHAVDPATQFNVATLYVRDRALDEVIELRNAIEASLGPDGIVRYSSYQQGDGGAVDIVERTFALPAEEGFTPVLPDPGSLLLRDDRIHTIRRVTGASEDGRFALIIGLGPTYIRDKDFQYVARLDLDTGLALPLNAALNWEGLPYNLNDTEAITAFMSADGDVVAMNNSVVSGNHDVSQLYAHVLSRNVLERVCSR